jgi:HD-like signal output (HDOD) protein
VHPDLLSKIKSFCSEKNLPSSTFEDLSAGMNHAEIGAKVAEKWNFPAQLVHAIQFHHDPTSAAPAERDLVFTVYLANMLCEYESGNVTFDQLEPQVLANFGLESKKHIDGLLERFSMGFHRDKESKV